MGVLLLFTLLPLARVVSGEGAGSAQDPAPSSIDHAAVPGPEAVMASLQRLFAWYQEARIVTQSARGVLDTELARGQEQTAQRALQRAFDTARARAAVLAQERRAGTPRTPQGRRAERVTQLQAALQQDERDIARLQARLRSTAAARPALDRELVAARNRRELDRVQLDFVTKLEQFDAAATGQEDLAHQIQTLQDAAPELSASAAAPTVVTAPPRAGAPSGGWALIYRLLALEHSRRSLHELTRETTQLLEDTDAEAQLTRQSVRPLVARLRALADGPGANGAPLATDQQEFRALLERAKLFGAVMLPLREQSALLRRYATDLQGSTRAINREVWEALRGLLIELVGVALALAAIFGCSVIWRIAVNRYVTNVYHRRLLLTARHVVVAIAVALVLVFHFTSELTALVAAFGFAAAGVAFALQNVILAVAGYFSMVAPNGIRVGDRVSIQGPFGYVHGEVIEIGMVRTRLQELVGEPLQSTGRIMVFPNSVVFTGSFIKHPLPGPRHA